MDWNDPSVAKVARFVTSRKFVSTVLSIRTLRTPFISDEQYRSKANKISRFSLSFARISIPGFESILGASRPKPYSWSKLCSVKAILTSASNNILEKFPVTHRRSYVFVSHIRGETFDTFGNAKNGLHLLRCMTDRFRKPVAQRSASSITRNKYRINLDGTPAR